MDTSKEYIKTWNGEDWRGLDMIELYEKQFRKMMGYLRHTEKADMRYMIQIRSKDSIYKQIAIKLLSE